VDGKANDRRAQAHGAREKAGDCYHPRPHFKRSDDYHKVARTPPPDGNKRRDRGNPSSHTNQKDKLMGLDSREAERREWDEDQRRYSEDPQKYWNDLGRKVPPNPLPYLEKKEKKK